MEQHKNILANIQRYVSLNQAEQEAFCSIVQTKEFSKKEFIVQPKEICKYQTYVVQGALRSYLIDDSGAEHTIQFAIEDWFISDFDSYIHQNPASLYVESVENSIVQQIAHQDVEELCESYPVFERFFRLVAQKSFAFAQKRILSNIGHSAEKRFVEFESRYPEIVQRMPQYALASYLGMSPEFLSKIRKRISKK